MNLLESISNSPMRTVNTSKQVQTPVLRRDEGKDILDIMSEKIVNRKDITDTVTVPRSIFKGYLCFTAGTAVNAIAGMLKQGKMSKALGITGSLVSIYGTYNFVKSFLVKDNNKNLTETEK